VRLRPKGPVTGTECGAVRCDGQAAGLEEATRLREVAGRGGSARPRAVVGTDIPVHSRESRGGAVVCKREIGEGRGVLKKMSICFETTWGVTNSMIFGGTEIFGS
jgi:hypothetical protein